MINYNNARWKPEIKPRSSPSWVANSFSPSQEIPGVLWTASFIFAFRRANHMFLLRARSSSPPPPYVLNIHLKIILPSTPSSTKSIEI